MGAIARSYDLVPQTVGNWVAKWRKEHPGPVTGELAPTENAEIRRLKAELREARMEAEFLKKSSGLLRPGTPVTTKYECIRGEEGTYPIRSMCRWAKVSRSGYYAWRTRPVSATRQQREQLAVMITTLFHDFEQTSGYRRIHAALGRGGVHASVDTVRSIMAEQGLVACRPVNGSVPRSRLLMWTSAGSGQPRLHRTQAGNQTSG